MTRTSCSLLLFTLLSVAGCVSPGAEWGSAVTFSPGWDQVKRSAGRAMKSPHTWVPLAGAALFSVKDYDEESLEWALRHSPIFGNQRNAIEISNDLKTLSKVNYLLTTMTVPADSFSSRMKGLSAGIVAIGISHGVTNGLKSVTNRQRPDIDRRNSFPSLHTSEATVAATLAARNIDYFEISQPAKVAWRVSSYTVAGLTAWARVEGNKHYPSEVLFGYALGHFLGAFFNDAFINPAYQDKIRIAVRSRAEGGALLSFDLQW